jgi:predicted O-methyltransferase YrrM
MIVRILNEGQWELSEEAVRDLNSLDDAIDRAVASADQEQLASALQALLNRVRSTGTVVPDDELRDSDLILPDADSTVEDVRALLSDSDEGLIPNSSRSGTSPS